MATAQEVKDEAAQLTAITVALQNMRGRMIELSQRVDQRNDEVLQVLVENRSQAEGALDSVLQALAALEASI